MYDMTSDGKPVLERSETVDDLYCAAGLTGNGFKRAARWPNWSAKAPPPATQSNASARETCCKRRIRKGRAGSAGQDRQAENMSNCVDAT